MLVLVENPAMTIDSNFIAVGTDDGLIQITKNGGQNWIKIDNIKGAPNLSYTSFFLENDMT